LQVVGKRTVDDPIIGEHLVRVGGDRVQLEVINDWIQRVIAWLGWRLRDAAVVELLGGVVDGAVKGSIYLEEDGLSGGIGDELHLQGVLQSVSGSIAV